MLPLTPAAASLPPLRSLLLSTRECRHAAAAMIAFLCSSCWWSLSAAASKASSGGETPARPIGAARADGAPRHPAFFRHAIRLRHPLAPHKGSSRALLPSSSFSLSVLCLMHLLCGARLYRLPSPAHVQTWPCARPRPRRVLCLSLRSLQAGGFDALLPVRQGR